MTTKNRASITSIINKNLCIHLVIKSHEEEGYKNQGSTESLQLYRRHFVFYLEAFPLKNLIFPH